MKMQFDKIPLFNKLPKVLRDRPVLSLVMVAFLAAILIFLVFAGEKETKAIGKKLGIGGIKKTMKQTEDKDVGVLVGQLDTKSYVSRIEKEYYDIISKFETLNERIGALEKNIKTLRDHVLSQKMSQKRLLIQKK